MGAHITSGLRFKPRRPDTTGRVLGPGPGPLRSIAPSPPDNPAWEASSSQLEGRELTSDMKGIDGL